MSVIDVFVGEVDNVPLDATVREEVVGVLKEAGLVVPDHLAGTTDEAIGMLMAGKSAAAGGLLKRKFERAAEVHAAKRLRATWRCDASTRCYVWSASECHESGADQFVGWVAGTGGFLRCLGESVDSRY